MGQYNNHQYQGPGPDPEPPSGREPDPTRWQELLAGYVLGDLSPEEMEQVQQYLAQHPEAQADVEELYATLNLLPLSLPEDAVPPESVRSRLLASAEAELNPQASAPADFSKPTSTHPPHREDPPFVRPNPTPGQRPRRPSTADRRSRWGIGLGSIAAASVIAILGVQNYRLQQSLQLAQDQHESVLQAVQTQLGEAELERDRYQEMIGMLRQPNNRLLPIQGSGYMKVSSGSLVIAPKKNWSVLTLQNLPTPPAGKAYQLWAVSDGQKIYCVEFMPDAEGKVLVEVPVDQWGNTPMVAITLEDAGTIPNEASEMIMNSPAI